MACDRAFAAAYGGRRKYRDIVVWGFAVLRNQPLGRPAFVCRSVSAEQTYFPLSSPLWFAGRRMAVAGWIDRATWDRPERGVEPARLCRFDLRGVWLDIRRGLVESQLNMGDGAPTPRGSFVRQASLYNVAPLTPKARIPFALRECA